MAKVQKKLKKFEKYSRAGTKESFYDGEQKVNIVAQAVYGVYREMNIFDSALKIKDISKVLQKIKDNAKNDIVSIDGESNIVAQTNVFDRLSAISALDIKDPENSHLTRLSPQDLYTIYCNLKKLEKVVDDYNKKKTVLSSMPAINNNYFKAIDTTLSVFEELNNGLSSAKTMDDSDTYSYSKLVSENNLDLDAQTDLEVVRALEFVGVTLEKQSGKWMISSKTQSNDNGIHYVSENNERKTFKLDENNYELIQSFLDNHLNKDKKDRMGVITAEGIFKLYVEEANKFFGKVRGLDKEGKNIQEQIINARDVTYSTNSPEWKSFLLGSKNLANYDATKIALIDISSENVRAERTTEELDKFLSEKYQDEIQRNNLISDRWLNKLIHSTKEIVKDQINENESFEHARGEIFGKYEEEKARLNTLISETSDPTIKAKLTAQLEEISNSIDTIKIYRNLVSFAKDDKAREVLKDALVSGRLVVNKKADGYHEILGLTDSEKSALQLNDPTIYGQICDPATFDKSHPSNPKQTQENPQSDHQNPTQDTNTASGNDASKDNFDAIFESFYVEGENNSKDFILENLKEWAMDDFANRFLSEYEREDREGQYSKLIDSYRTLKEKNPNIGSMQDFLNSMSQQMGEDGKPLWDRNGALPLFTDEVISNYEVLTRDNSEAYKNSPEYKTAQGRSEFISNNADRIFTTFAIIGAELNGMTFNSPEDKNRYISQRYEELKNQPQPTDKLSDETKNLISSYKDFMRNSYGCNIIESLHDNDILSSDSEKGKKEANKVVKTLSNISNDPTFQDMAGDLKKEVAGKESQEKDAENEAKLIKFSDKYPKDKTGDILKKLKPYCEKSTGKIIDRLLKMIEGCEMLIEDKKVTPPHPSQEKDNNTDNSSKGSNDQRPIIPEGHDNEPKARDIDDTKLSDDNTKGNDDNNSKESDPNKDTIEPQHDEDKKEPTPEPPTHEEPENKEPQPEEPVTEEPKVEEPKKDSGANMFDDNVCQLDKGEFATYKILSLGLRGVLESPAFEKNRKWLNDNEKNKLSSISKVLKYVTSNSAYPEGTKEYEQDIQLKKQLAYEIQLKAKTPSDTKSYNSGTKPNIESFYKDEFGEVVSQELIDSISCVMHDCNNLEDIGQMLAITTDLPKTEDIHRFGDGGVAPLKFEIGNKLSEKDLEEIAKCNGDKELWTYIKNNPEMYEGFWNVPGVMSENLANELKKSLNEELTNDM